MGLSYNIAGANLGFTYTSNYYATDEKKFKASYALGSIASFAVGVQQSTEAKTQGLLGRNQQEIAAVESGWYVNPSDGVSFGVSLNLSQYAGMNLIVDYAMLPAGDFGNNNVIALRVGF